MFINWYNHSIKYTFFSVTKKEKKHRKMAERYYPNEMPDLSIEELAPENARDSLCKLLSLPYDTISQRLKLDAINLKDEVSFSFNFFYLFR